MFETASTPWNKDRKVGPRTHFTQEQANLLLEVLRKQNNHRDPRSFFQREWTPC